MKTFWICLGIGLAAGGFGGLLGIGGGMIMVPLMLGVLKLSQHEAHGTSLIALVFTGLAGAMAYGLKGHVDYPAAAALALSAMTTVRAGARHAHALPAGTLRKWFGIFLIVCAALLFARPWLTVSGSVHPLPVQILILIITGAAAGFLSGMMGVGGGAVMIPAMVVFAGFGQHAAQGTSLLVMVPAGLTGSLAHYQLGHVVKKHLPGLISGILLGAFLGSLAANFVPDLPLRLVFMSGIVVMGIKYIVAKTPPENEHSES